MASGRTSTCRRDSAGASRTYSTIARTTAGWTTATTVLRSPCQLIEIAQPVGDPRDEVVLGLAARGRGVRALEPGRRPAPDPPRATPPGHGRPSRRTRGPAGPARRPAVRPSASAVRTAARSGPAYTASACERQLAGSLDTRRIRLGVAAEHESTQRGCQGMREPDVADRPSSGDHLLSDQPAVHCGGVPEAEQEPQRRLRTERGEPELPQQRSGERLRNLVDPRQDQVRRHDRHEEARAPHRRAGRDRRTARPSATRRLRPRPRAGRSPASADRSRSAG